MVKLTIETAPDADAQQAIDLGLDIYNAAHAGPERSSDYWVIARDTDGKPVGGARCHVEFAWVYLEWLWLAETHRRDGLGRQIVDMVEDTARARGCIGAYVSSYSFQAPDFYRRLGYQEFGRLPDLPPGHFCVWLQKRL